MLKKMLLIGESGLLPFYFSQDDVKIDNDLLSGFCQAIYGISLELAIPLKNIGFENHKMVVKSFDHECKRQYLISALFDEYHIDEGVVDKITFIFEKLINNIDLKHDNKRIANELLDKKVKNIINDVPLKLYILRNLNLIKGLLDPILEQKENLIHAYALSSSMNNILYINGTEEIFTHRPGQSLSEIIKEYLLLLKIDKVPQGDHFIGLDIPTGLDLVDYLETEEKTLGIVIPTGLNLKEEPKNELLLYFFGKNMLMRTCVSDIEIRLREELFKTEEVLDNLTINL